MIRWEERKMLKYCKKIYPGWRKDEDGAVEMNPKELARTGGGVEHDAGRDVIQAV